MSFGISLGTWISNGKRKSKPWGDKLFPTKSYPQKLICPQVLDTVLGNTRTSQLINSSGQVANCVKRRKQFAEQNQSALLLNVTSLINFQLTGNIWHVTCNMWHVTCNMWHVTWDTSSDSVSPVCGIVNTCSKQMVQHPNNKLNTN